MKHVSWIVALILGLAVGFFAREALDGRPGRSPSPFAASPPGAAQPQAARPARPTEDPAATYRIPVDGSAAKGPADALVTIVESSDFECPFCRRALPTMRQIAEQYAGRVRFVFKHNPLPNHPQALPAAMAIEEARAQGGDEKFWAMHDALFDAPSLDAAAIEAAAAKVGLDVAKVKAAIASRKHEARVTKDQQLVRSVGAGGTPTFFVNGRKLVGAQPFDRFKPVIEEELAKAERLVKAGTPAGEVYEKIVAAGATAPVMIAGLAEPTPAEPAVVIRKVDVRADDPAKGPKDAKLTVVLFSDFQCPYCARVEPTMTQLLAAFPDDVRVVWKHQPLSFHPQALPAALAAEAAREQGKFWQMHEKLFESQKELSPATYTRLAKEVGLDEARFAAALESRRHEARVKEDQSLANSVGANGTPTMFLNCRQAVGALPLERLRPIVEEELRKADALLKGGKPDAGFYDKACAANVAASSAAARGAQGAAPVPTGFAPAGAAVKLDVRPDDPTRGDPKAPVTIVVFSDFQCPYCARVEPIMKDVERAYGDKVKVVWKHQPLSFHPQALPAAEAAEAAREQGKFWQMHDRLFESQRALSPALYEQVARELGLDVGRFKASIASGKSRERIEQDRSQAMNVGANSTPTLFINGEKVVGARPLEQLRPVIDRALAKR